ncbi:STAS domain-containing protein [Saccharothrix sp. AJ9571]|nr:STAS domain-containing protein [Saccharothrix sp. AJ9571]
MLTSGMRTAEQDITIAVAWHGGAVELAVTGELDTTTAPLLEEAIAYAVKEDPTALVVNLDAVQFLASAGISVLIEANCRLPELLRVVTVSEIVLRPLTITGLDRVLPLYPTTRAALAP